MVEDNKKLRLQEIDVERINIIDADGKIRMAISGKDRSPGWVIRGKEFRGRPRHAGIIFYNDDSEECGGLVFGNEGIGLMFDQRDQDQIVGLMYSEENGSRWYGLYMWDRPDKPFLQMVERHRAIRAMPDGPEKEDLMRKFREDYPSPLRLFVGREKTPDKNEAKVIVADSQGRERVRVVVDSNDCPRVEILDENGKVIYRIPPE